jgi:chromosome segregation ATPase
MIMDDRKEYMNKLRDKFEHSKKQIEQMRANADRAEANIKQDYLREVDALESKLHGFQNQYSQLESANETAWDSIKLGAESAWEGLTEAVENAAKRFGGDDTNKPGDSGRFDRNRRN